MPLSAHGGAFRSKDPIKRWDGSAGTAAHAHTETNNVLTPWSTRSSFPPPWKAKAHMAIYMWSKFCDPGAIPGNTTPQQRKQRFLFIIKASYKERTSAAKRLRVCLRVVRRYAHLVLIIYVCLCLWRFIIKKNITKVRLLLLSVNKHLCANRVLMYSIIVILCFLMYLYYINNYQ